MKRQHTRLLVAVAAVALLAAACGDDDDDSSTSDTTSGGDSGEATVDASELVMGGPADCESNGYCLPGLERVYGVDLASNFTPLDAGLVLPALQDGQIDIGVFFSTDPVLADDGLVVLEDDEEMTAADNIFPVASQEVADAYDDDLTEVLDAVSAELTTEELIELNTAHDVDREDPDAVASAWLEEHSDLEGMVEAPAEGPALTFGAQQFGESAVLAELYSQVLQANGFESGTTEVGGFRDLLFGAFESGDVNIAIDYVASELEYLNDNAGEATHDVDETFGLLEPLLEEQSLVGFTPSEAVNTNVFVVTTDWSEENGVTALSQLSG